jgi:hypothetical protein
VKKVQEILFSAQRHALGTNGFPRQRVIGIEQRLRRRIADDVDPGLTVLQEIADLLVGAVAVAFA